MNDLVNIIYENYDPWFHQISGGGQVNVATRQWQGLQKLFAALNGDKNPFNSELINLIKTFPMIMRRHGLRNTIKWLDLHKKEESYQLFMIFLNVLLWKQLYDWQIVDQEIPKPSSLEPDNFIAIIDSAIGNTPSPRAMQIESAMWGSANLLREFIQLQGLDK